jgi:hypothetical protein
MPETGIFLNRLYARLETSAKNRRIDDVRLGLSYVGVKLDNQAAGIAAVLPDNSGRGCMALKEAGTYTGAGAESMLKYLLESKNSLHLSIGLALANALVKLPVDTHEDREATTYFNIKSGEKVAMVGLFAPLVERIRATSAQLTIIEKNPARINLLSGEEKKHALKECDVAIITATTLLNNSLEETLAMLGRPRIVALMGPSTPLVPEIFLGTPINHLGGAIVTNAQRVLQIISEGGGTPALRPYLHFVNLNC